MADEIIKGKEVAQLIGIGYSTFRAGIKYVPDFPQPINNRRCTTYIWNRCSVDNWVAKNDARSVFLAAYKNVNNVRIRNIDLSEWPKDRKFSKSGYCLPEHTPLPELRKFYAVHGFLNAA